MSVWEISIKRSLGKLDTPDEYLDVASSQGFVELPISWQHSKVVDILPHYHNDPFDRLLITQAQVEGMTLLTSDSNIAKYDVPLI